MKKNKKEEKVKLTPIPKTNLREKKGYFQEWIREGDKWLIRREVYTKTLDTVLRKWVVTESHIEWLTPSDLGHVKSIDFSVIIEREGFTSTMKKRKIYALQAMKAEIPDIEEYKHLLLKLIKPTYFKRRFEKGAICLNDLNTQVTQKLSVGIDRRIKAIGKEQLITKSQAQKLLKECKVLGIFVEVNERLTECISFINLRRH